MTAKQASGLAFRGGRRHILGVPARDLTPADLERIVYRDAGRLRPGDAGFAEALAKRRASLVRGGLYEELGRAEPATPAVPAPDVTPPSTDVPPAVDQDAAPAAKE